MLTLASHPTVALQAEEKMIARGEAHPDIPDSQNGALGWGGRLCSILAQIPRRRSPTIRAMRVGFCGQPVWGYDKMAQPPCTCALTGHNSRKESQMTDRVTQAQAVMQSLPHAQSLGMIVTEMSAGSTTTNMFNDPRLIGDPAGQFSVLGGYP